MKKLIFGLLSLLLVLGAAQAQDGKKELRNASKAMGAYNLDPSNNKDKLQEAVTEIEAATTGSETKMDPKTWLTKGEIYNEIAQQIVTVRQLQIGSLDDLPKVERPAYEAAMAFSKALELAEKKYEIKDALKGLQTSQGNLYNLGIYAYEDRNFDVAYENFKQVVAIHQTLKEQGETSSLDETENYNNQLYITGLAALNSGKTEDARPLFEELYKSGFEEAAIYEALYKLEADNDLDAAYKYLEAGRQKYPDEVSLLFAEINHFLKLNKLDELIGKLEMAIEKEPENVSLYTTMGNVYDNLYQKAAEAGETEKAQEYFDNALKYYNQALEKDPKFFDAIYSVGALYYNKAAAMSLELNKLADDYSREGLKKYEEMKEKVFAQFDEALPYFQKAEAIDANDVNTLIALKEIYARKDDLDTSNEFKKRLETVQGGGTNESSYFN